MTVMSVCRYVGMTGMTGMTGMSGMLELGLKFYDIT